MLDPEQPNRRTVQRILSAIPKNLLLHGYAVTAIVLSLQDGIGGAEALVTSIGYNVLSDLLLKLRGGANLSEEEIREQVLNAISQSEIESKLEQNQVLIGRLFRHFDIIGISIKEFQTETIELLMKQTDGFKELKGEIQAELPGISKTLTHLLRQSSDSREQIATLQQKIDLIDHILGIESALSKYPKTKRPHLDLPIIGREEEWQWLIDKHTDKEDCLLVGQPGSGKTFLARRLVTEFAGYFVVGFDRQQILRELTVKKPRVLIVDDAHRTQGLIADLMQMRDGGTFEFTIVATCWPTFRPKLSVAMRLTSQGYKELPLLTRVEIKRLLKNLELEGPPWLIKEFIDQSEGKPGLAVTLVDAYRRGAHDDVFSGSKLADSIIHDYLDGPNTERNAKDILAALSLGGDSGMSPEVIASALELTRRTVDNMLADLTAAGIVFENPDGNISVRPRALRYALLREVFFASNRQPASVEQLLQQTPRISETVIALVEAHQRGAIVPNQQLVELLQRMEARHSVFEPFQREAWRAYASIGTDESLWILKEHPELLNEVAGVTLHFATRETIRRLLDSSVNDNRPLNSNPDHALRLLEDWVARLNDRNVLTHRKTLLDEAFQWYKNSENVDITLKIIKLIFSPELESLEEDPADDFLAGFRRGYFTETGIEELERLWDIAREELQTMPIVNWLPLVELLYSWLRSPSISNQEEDTKTRDAGNNFYNRLIIDVYSLSPQHDGLARVISKFAKLRHLTVNIDISNDFAIIYPPEKWAGDIESIDKENHEAVQKLAERWLERPPSDVIADIVHFQDLALQVDIRHPNFSYSLMEFIADNCQDPALWFDEIVSVDKAVYFLGPFVARLNDCDEEIWKPRILAILMHNETASIALKFLLCRSNLDAETLDITLSHATSSDSIEHIVGWNIIPDYVVEALLSHADSKVRSATAKGLWWKNDKKITPDHKLYQLWSAILLERAEDDWMLSEVLKSDSHLASRWLQKLVSEPHPYYFRHDDAIRAALVNLTNEQKIGILKSLSNPERHCELITLMVDIDITLFREILAIDRLGPCHLSCIPFINDPSWFSFAQAALDKGYEEERIAHSSLWRPLTRLYSDNERQESWKLYLDVFKEYCCHEDGRIRLIAKYGIRLVDTELAVLRERKRQHDVFGRD